MNRDQSQKSQQRSESLHRTLYYAFHNPLFGIYVVMTLMGLHAMYEEWMAKRRQAMLARARATSQNTALTASEEQIEHQRRDNIRSW